MAISTDFRIISIMSNAMSADWSCSLTFVISLGQAFQDFQEGRIKFKPTYKFDLGTNTYDTKKMRVPSYTVSIHSYTVSIHSCTVSIRSCTASIPSYTMSIPSYTVSIPSYTVSIHSCTVSIHSCTVSIPPLCHTSPGQN